MDNVYNLPPDPTHFLKYYFGEKYVVLSITDHATQYAIGSLSSVEVAYLVKILDIIATDKITGGLDEDS